MTRIRNDLSLGELAGRLGLLDFIYTILFVVMSLIFLSRELGIDLYGYMYPFESSMGTFLYICYISYISEGTYGTEYPYSVSSLLRRSCD